MASYRRVGKNVRVDDSDVRLWVRQAKRRARNLKPVFRELRGWLRERAERAFDTEGRSVGFHPAGWAELNPSYASWKIENYGANGILVRTGALRRSYTVANARGALGRVTDSSLVYGSAIPYASFHHEGTRFMPRRRVLESAGRTGDKAAELIADYVVDGREPNAGSPVA